MSKLKSNQASIQLGLIGSESMALQLGLIGSESRVLFSENYITYTGIDVKRTKVRYSKSYFQCTRKKHARNMPKLKSNQALFCVIGFCDPTVMGGSITTGIDRVRESIGFCFV